MKTLFLLRHAKSSWADDNLADFDRPLNKRGLEIMPRLGEKVHDRQFPVGLILSSPAKRAKQTAILIKETAQLKADIRYDEKIYEASPHRLLEVITATADDNKSLMLVGHNPGLEGLIRVLTGETRPMETAMLAVIDLHIEHWNEADTGRGNVRQMIDPKGETEASEADW